MCLNSRTTFARTCLLVATTLVFLSACTGDNSRGSAGQDPDPVVLDIPIAYIKRPLPTEDGDNDVNTAETLIEIDQREPAAFHPGASLWVRDRAAPSAAERNITQRLVGVDPAFINANPDFLPEQYDVKDISPSWDGKKIVFALHAPMNPDLDEEDPGQPTWNIWEYELATDTLRRVIEAPITAEAGHDIAPAYLPDGRIVFSSTRQRQAKAILLDEGKSNFTHMDEERATEAMSLHVMQDDGSDIEQISFNQSHDLDASVLSDGRLVYTRWDDHRLSPEATQQMHLYTMNSDGSVATMDKTYGTVTNRHASTLLYGNRSHATGSNNSNIQFLKPRQLQDGRMMAIVKPFRSAHYGGDIIAINTHDYVNNVEAVTGQTGTGPAQSRLSLGNVQIDETSLLSPGGRFNSAWPLWDGSGRLLVSWSQCRFIEGSDTTSPRIVPCSADNLTRFAAQPADCAAPACMRLDEARPLYGIYTYDIASQTQLPITLPVEDQMITDVVAIAARTLPTVTNPQVADSALAAAGVAELHIRSVYDFDGRAIDPATYQEALDAQTVVDIAQLADPTITPVANRPARFIRIEKAVSLPSGDVRNFNGSAFGFSDGFMREILGYVPVEPDGSAKFQVPANVAIGFQILDGNGHRIGPRHNNWLNFKAGEKVTCSGCHLPQGVPVDAANPAAGNRILPHGRADAEASSINAGAVNTGQPFPHTNIALWADAGETMAEVWARLNGSRQPSVDIIFDDDWSTAGNEVTPFAWQYSDFPARAEADSNSIPTSNGCQTAWNATCRITIHYLRHIQPVWNAPRAGDNRCINCHAGSDKDGNPQVPLASLELTSEQDANFNNYARGFAQLFRARNQYEDKGGGVYGPVFNPVSARQEAPIPNVNDPTKLECAIGIPDDNAMPTTCYVCPQGVNNNSDDPAICDVPVMVNAPLRENDARGSTGFFDLFKTGGSHEGFLTDGELKMIAEWVDIGAQYYNDPFVAPE